MILQLFLTKILKKLKLFLYDKTFKKCKEDEPNNFWLYSFPKCIYYQLSSLAHVYFTNTEAKAQMHTW